jgi:hypothetical protein
LSAGTALCRLGRLVRDRRCGEQVSGGRSSTPAHGVEEGVELVGPVKADRLRQGDLLDDPGPRLDLPDHLKFFAQAVVLDGGEGEQVLRAAEGGFEGRRRGGCWGARR